MLTRDVQRNAAALMERSGEPKRGEKDHLMARLAGGRPVRRKAVLPPRVADKKSGWIRRYNSELKKYVYEAVKSD